METSAVDRELDAWLSEKENDMVEDIASLVEIPSISGGTKGQCALWESLPGGPFKDTGNRPKIWLFLSFFSG